MDIFSLPFYAFCVLFLHYQVIWSLLFPMSIVSSVLIFFLLKNVYKVAFCGAIFPRNYMPENIIPFHLNDDLARHKILGSSVFIFSMETIMNLLIFSPVSLLKSLKQIWFMLIWRWTILFLWKFMEFCLYFWYLADLRIFCLHLLYNIFYYDPRMCNYWCFYLSYIYYYINDYTHFVFYIPSRLL